MQKYYKAEMDRLLRITTRVVSVIFIFPAAALAVVWYEARYAPPGCGQQTPLPGQVLDFGLVLLLLLLAATAYLTKAMAPVGYALNDIELLIDRKLKPVKIPLAEILEVSALEDGLLRRSLRLMGTSGYYGYYGLFWNKGLGKYRAYATRTTGLVAVKTAKSLFVLTPENPEDFMASLRALLRR